MTAITGHERVEGAMFGAVGLHWLSGLLQLAQGDAADAERHFERELAFEGSGHLYARECCSATWYAKGAQAWHRGDRSTASRAFSEVLRRVPRHPLALAALADEVPDDQFEARLQSADERGANVDVAVARAVRQVAREQTPQPALLLPVLRQVPPGASGWYLPVEPMLRPLADMSRWGAALALLRSRAG